MQSIIFKKTIISQISNNDIRIIPFINGEWIEESFEKMIFRTRARKVS